MIRNFLRYTLVLGLFLAFPYGSHAEMTKSEIESICENESFTMLERLVAKALIKDFEKGSLWNIEVILSRSIGRPKETTAIEQDTKIEVVFVEGKTIL